MFYKKNQSAVLDDALFKNPTAEYRGTPFWAWNDTLDKEDLLWQIEQLKKMGFGGFHMHSRSGMATPYLSEEFMDLVKACTDKAKAEEMLSYLYDEDRWPSGSAGGIVTKNKKYRQKTLRFTPEAKDDAELGTATCPATLILPPARRRSRPVPPRARPICLPPLTWCWTERATLRKPS